MKDQKRASLSSLEKIAELLSDLRNIEALDERRPGVFYAGRKELLHFHELPEAMVADLFLPNERIRIPVTSRTEQLELLDRIWPTVEHLEREANRDQWK